MSRCLVLFSGGIDSTTALYWARREYREVIALSIDYSQRHGIELSCARKIAALEALRHEFLSVDLSQIGGSALTDRGIEIPVFSSENDIGENIPITYVPFRNGIFLALAVAWGEKNDVRDIICGFNVIDNPNYPDTTESFVAAMEEAANRGTKPSAAKKHLRIKAPFIHKTKSEIIRWGLSIGADYSFSISCYAGREIPCGRCSSCLLRRKAWAEVGEEDHLTARLKKEGRI